MSSPRISPNARRVVAVLCVVVIASILIFSGLLVRYTVIEHRFRNIHPDESEARLLEVVGAPSSLGKCGQSGHQFPKAEAPGARHCAKEYWYKAYIFQDGWLVWIDDDGTIIQIKRLALP